RLVFQGYLSNFSLLFTNLCGEQPLATGRDGGLPRLPLKFWPPTCTFGDWKRWVMTTLQQQASLQSQHFDCPLLQTLICLSSTQAIYYYVHLSASSSINKQWDEIQSSKVHSTIQGSNPPTTT